MAAPHSVNPAANPTSPASEPISTAPAEDDRRTRILAWLLPLLPLLFMGVAVLIVVIKDARLKPNEIRSGDVGVAHADLPDLLDTQPRIDCQFHDSTEMQTISKDGMRKPTGGVVPPP